MFFVLFLELAFYVRVSESKSRTKNDTINVFKGRKLPSNQPIPFRIVSSSVGKYFLGKITRKKSKIKDDNVGNIKSSMIFKIIAAAFSALLIIVFGTFSAYFLKLV